MSWVGHMPDRWVRADDPELPEDVWVGLAMSEHRDRVERGMRIHCVRAHHSDDLRSCTCPGGQRFKVMLQAPESSRG